MFSSRMLKNTQISAYIKKFNDWEQAFKFVTFDGTKKEIIIGEALIEIRYIKDLEEHEMEEKRPIILVVIDGIGLNRSEYGNAVKAACTPTFDSLIQTCPNIVIKAHGIAVGLPSDEDMGNSDG